MIRNVRSMMTGLIGQENQELNFTKAKLEALLLHQCTCVHVTVWDLIWVWGFKRHVQLCVVCIALVWKFIQADEPGRVYGKEQQLEHWSFGGPRWRAGEGPRAGFTKTIWMNTQKGKSQTRTVPCQWYWGQRQWKEGCAGLLDQEFPLDKLSTELKPKELLGPWVVLHGPHQS